MPLLGSGEYREPVAFEIPREIRQNQRRATLPERRQSQHSVVAKSVILGNLGTPSTDGSQSPEEKDDVKEIKPLESRTQGAKLGAPSNARRRTVSSGYALTDTPQTTAPNSPIIPPLRRDSGSSTPAGRARPTTLDIPGLTKSKVSPDGKIAQRDLGAKLVIIMVGLPGRGKSYVCRKLARYLNWLQHDTKVFNVGERRRVAAAATPGVPDMDSIKQHTGQLPVRHKSKKAMDAFNNLLNGKLMLTPPPSPATRILVNGEMPQEPPALDMLESLPPAMMEINRRYLEDSDEDTDEEEEEEEEEEQEDEEESHDPKNTNGDDQGIEQEQLAKLQMPPPPLPRIQSMDQTAGFFDPGNHQAANIREQVALGTMDELLDYILDRGGSVGIFDATNSTLERRKSLMERIRERAGPELGVLFLESVCFDETLLESNMRLKLSGPDYRDSDPVTALADFKQRIAMYEKQYVPLGEYEEKHNMQYLQIIDVGRKIVSHQIKGFLAAQANYYLLNFNLAPRQIWITRHGESVDNLSGKLGGDSDLSEYGRAYGQALTRFIKHEREAWEIHQREKALSTHFPPQAGDTTPPNPEYQTHGSEDGDEQLKSFCVWTSMLKRSVQTAQYFDEEDYDIKQMKMLDELNAGVMEGLTYEEIKSRYKDEYELRKRDKLHYRYPGAGGEGYLDVINRLRAVIVEAERMTDHLLLVCHRSVARVLLAYFKGLARDDVANLDVPLGMLYMLEPKPYGVDFKAYRYNPITDWFDYIPNYELRRANTYCPTN